MRIIEEFHTPKNIAAKGAVNRTVCLTPQPTRGQLMGVLPLLDYAIPALPRLMTRREWRKTGYLVRQRQEPIRKDTRIEGKFYDGKWHPWLLGTFTREQCVTVEEDAAAKQRRVESEEASKAEWSKIQDISRLDVLTDGARRKYIHLYEKAKAANTATVITNNAEIAAACKIRKDDIKGHRDELIRHGFIQYKLTVGRQSHVTVNALL